MFAQVLLNLLNELKKSDKMLDKPRILSLFLYSFNRFNTMQYRSTNVRFYLSYDNHNFFEICIFGVTRLRSCHYSQCRNRP